MDSKTRMNYTNNKNVTVIQLTNIIACDPDCTYGATRNGIRWDDLSVTGFFVKGPKSIRRK